ncbi:DUF3037 domain-containing protein [Bacillus paramycoides]|uniref:DUF3037 domain-containing protein n=1 Tax=Bacillus paramycoides TaxID=2026194 RepID=UPI003D023534
MDKQKNWYSIIRYMPSTIRGEVLNVGLMLHNPESGELKYQILDSNNTKLKCLLANDVQLETYRVHKEVIDYYLHTLPTEGTLLDPNAFTNAFLEELNSNLPNGFKLSEPTFSKTSNIDKLFKTLLETYVGKEFLLSVSDYLQVNTKKYIKKYFDDRNLVGTKVKYNAKLTPIKDIHDMQFTIDFVYKNGVINLLQAAPSNKDHLNNWFAKINTLLETYKKESGLYVFYDNNNPFHTDDLLWDMINYLQVKDPRVKHLDINSNDFIELCNRIESDGQLIEDFESELSVS